ncbi:MAG: alpha/beta hydrolase [Clostridia bacterium]|nr:alpha/beta hydrolase [Clostridia bacterium]
MRHEVIRLCEDSDGVTLTSYVPLTRAEKSDAMLVIPGGGYNHICADREGESVAMAFAARGIHCFVLTYSLGEKAKFPRPLLEASLAMAYIHGHAEEYGIDPARIFVCGFSAGGHLAASLGTRWHTDEVNGAIDIPFGSNRPCGMLLCYPVLSYMPDIKQGTFEKVFGTSEPTREQIEFCSPDRNLSREHLPPAFLWQTANDPAVNIKNTLRMATALSEVGAPFEVHIFPNGPHGMALATDVTAPKPMYANPRIAQWVDLAFSWMKTV